MPTAKYVHGARDLRALRSASPRTFGLYERRARSRPRSPSSTGTTPRRAGSSAPTAATSSAPGSWPWAPVRSTGPKLPGHPGHRDLRRPLRSTPAAGTTRTPAATRRRADDEPRRQAGRHHRHRRDRGAVHPAARPRRRRAVRVPAHAVVDRRAQQPRDRPRVVRDARARAGSSEWLLNFATLQTGGFADEDLVKDGWTDISQRIRDRVIVEHVADGDGARPRRVPSAPTRTATTRRWTRSGRGSTTSSRTATTADGAEALVPPAVQAAVLPRRVPAGLQPAERATSSTPTARASAHRRDRRVGRRTSTTSSTA